MVGVITTGGKLSGLAIDADLAMGAHNITLDAAQTVDGKDVSSVGLLPLATVQVVTNGADVGWTDVNCEAHVGTGKCILLVKIVKTNNNGTVHIKSGDEEDDPPVFDLLINGIARALVYSAAGHFQYKTAVGYAQIYLEGYIKE